MDDDHLSHMQGGGTPPDLQSWNLEDLEDYIARLKNEITRVEAKMAEKKAVSSAAASLFKS